MVRNSFQKAQKFGREYVILGLGSNKGWNSESCLSILGKAVEALKTVLSDLQQASLYETEPIPKSAGLKNFLNTAVSGLFTGRPEELLDRIHRIEASFGRDRTREVRWGDRSLDIDILLFGNLAVSSPLLVIPHPRLEERRFALEPLLELWPEASSPITGKPYSQIRASLPDQGVRRFPLVP
ncbi:MAG: 2-amino-4-hydroxy-6-hydroxymethyldihydropteridine diphosphokinase [Treponema sp.]|nr:2-amino-4-hydroxy-6-hydroxymethyldihydropteridine diphosphokinase [Treponema sp.]